jgi:hypothetical protein
VVASCAREWRDLFPQHGPGRKHLRPIILAPWQREVVESHPFNFLRGLIESDGWLVDRKVAGKVYPAYEFGNESSDIIGIFCWAARFVGLHYTLPTRNKVSIARRRDVATLSHYIPDKRSLILLSP